MKNKVLILFVILGLILASSFSVAASTLEPVHNPVSLDNSKFFVGENQAVVSFAELGYQDLDLASPYDSTSVLFSTPPNWQLTEGGVIELNFDVLLSGADVAKIAEDQKPYGGFLSVRFNNQVLGNIYLDVQGSQTASFQIPPSALTSSRRDGRHELEILLNARFSCTYDVRSVIIIKSTSLFQLPFDISSPNLSLSQLPAPLYLRDSLLPEQTLFVVPDDPSVDELQAALNVIAGFGSMVGQDFSYDLVSIGQLPNDEDLGAYNFVFVGLPSQFDVLSEVNFQLAIIDGQFVEDQQTPLAEDGVIQMALSPWNSSKTVLQVSGNSDEAIRKAAQALSSGKVFIYDDPVLARVSSVQLLTKSIPIVEDFSFQSLGYTNEILSGIGVHSTEYLFYVPKEQVNTKDGYLDFIYYHSGLLNYGSSSLVIELNNQVISSIAFSKETEQVTDIQIKFPPGFLRFGENRLSVSATMQPDFSCDSTGFSDPWVTVLEQSSFHLPVSLDDTAPDQFAVDLKFYPDLFLTNSDLSEIAFILPKANPASWSIAANIAFNLGRTANPLIANLSAAFADEVPEEIKNNHSLVYVGKASTLPSLIEINDDLPAPFDLQKDTASEKQMQIVYRIPPGVSVGYLEMLRSPFNSQKAILVVAGNDDAGVALAGNALMDPVLSSQLAGLFAVTNGEQVAATTNLSSQFSIVGSVIPSAEVVVATPIQSPPIAPPEYTRPNWLLPIFATSGVAIFLVIAFVAMSAISRSRSARPDISESSTGDSDDADVN